MMIAVLFELWPAPGHDKKYFDWAANLKPELENIPGFVCVERFESLAQPGKYLSLSFWRDEASVRSWRNQPHHRLAQADGRSGIFQDYRLRVAQVVRDYGLRAREQAPTDSREFHAATGGA